MCESPVHPDVTVYVYADDTAFFASATDIHALYLSPQAYLSAREVWLDNINLVLNVRKSCVLVFQFSVQHTFIYLVTLSLEQHTTGGTFDVARHCL